MAEKPNGTQTFRALKHLVRRGAVYARPPMSSPFNQA